MSVSSKNFLDIQAIIECRFALKRVCDMIITYSHIQFNLCRSNHIHCYLFIIEINNPLFRNFIICIMVNEVGWATFFVSNKISLFVACVQFCSIIRKCITWKFNRLGLLSVKKWHGVPLICWLKHMFRI